MSFRYEGTFRGEGMKSLGFQLMDWSSHSWVTVFVRSGIAAGPVAIEHELAPTDFVGRDTPEVWLRVVAPGGPFDSWTVETRQVTLEVNYASSTVQPG